MAITESFIKQSIIDRTFTTGDFNTLGNHDFNTIGNQTKFNNFGLFEKVILELCSEYDFGKATKSLRYVLNKVEEQLNNGYWLTDVHIQLGSIFQRVIKTHPEFDWKVLFSSFIMQDVLKHVVRYDIEREGNIFLKNYNSYRALQGIYTYIENGCVSNDILYSVSDTLMEHTEKGSIITPNIHMFSDIIRYHLYDLYLDKWPTLSKFKQAYFIQLIDYRFSRENNVESNSNIDFLIEHLGNFVPHDFLNAYVSYKNMFDLEKPPVNLIQDMWIAYQHKDEHMSCELPVFG